MIIFFNLPAIQSRWEREYNQRILDSQLKSLQEQHKHPERFGNEVDKWLKALCE